jgi:hypothetical protein
VVPLHDRLFALTREIRYVAVVQSGQPELQVRPGLDHASSAESDRYEELLVNPALITLTKQRGNIDCGGLDYLIVRYGNFFQIVIPTSSGHVSVAAEPTADPVEIARQVLQIVKQ